ncbi:MAG: hypothetical protein J6A21_09760 [Lentisphaeria bacterium]|nr:hypothetical protein [Lentisphaeria bacterium]
MACKCRTAEDGIKSVEESCMICAQKHFTAAWRALKELGYELNETNHDFAIGELGLAAGHLRNEFPLLAGKVREMRHHVQYWEYGKLEEKWKEVLHEMNQVIRKEITAEKELKKTNALSSSPGEKENTGNGKIYVISNVPYPEENKLHPEKEDLLVFLNKAESVHYYKDHSSKIVYHRSPKTDYGTHVPGCVNFYVFEGTGSLPKDFIKELKSSYDWNYEIEEGKVKSMTTGYMVVKYLAMKHPGRKIVLVNFGYDVKNSTYRCPWHNWKFEAEALASFEHMSLEK